MNIVTRHSFLNTKTGVDSPTSSMTKIIDKGHAQGCNSLSLTFDKVELMQMVQLCTESSFQYLSELHTPMQS